MANIGRALLFCPFSPKVAGSVLDEALKFSSPPQGVCLASPSLSKFPEAFVQPRQAGALGFVMDTPVQGSNHYSLRHLYKAGTGVKSMDTNLNSHP